MARVLVEHAVLGRFYMMDFNRDGRGARPGVPVLLREEARRLKRAPVDVWHAVMAVKAVFPGAEVRHHQSLRPRVRRRGIR